MKANLLKNGVPIAARSARAARPGVWADVHPARTPQTSRVRIVNLFSSRVLRTGLRVQSTGGALSLLRHRSHHFRTKPLRWGSSRRVLAFFKNESNIQI